MSARAPIQIRVYDDRLVLVNPAVLPEGWTQESLLAPHYSQPFNPDIANTFFRAGEIEAWGRGIERIFEACRKEGAPEPQLRHEANGLWLEFPFAQAYLNVIRGDHRRPAPEVTDPVTPEVTPEVERLLAVLTGEMSRTEIMAVLGLKDEKHFREHYQQAAARLGYMEMTIPSKPRSRMQKYRLTAAGRALVHTLNTERSQP